MSGQPVKPARSILVSTYCCSAGCLTCLARYGCLTCLARYGPLVDTVLPVALQLVVVCSSTTQLIVQPLDLVSTEL